MANGLSVGPVGSDIAISVACGVTWRHRIAAFPVFPDLRQQAGYIDARLFFCVRVAFFRQAGDGGIGHVGQQYAAGARMQQRPQRSYLEVHAQRIRALYHAQILRMQSVLRGQHDGFAGFGIEALHQVRDFAMD
jgi:hypothetical protein